MELAAVKLQLQKYQTELKEKKKEKTTKVMNVQVCPTEEKTEPTTDQLVTAIKMVMQAQQPQNSPTMTSNTPPNRPLAVIYNGVQNRGRGGPRYMGRGGGNPTYTDRCFICHKMGHWRRDCPMAQGQNYRQNGQPRQNYQLQTQFQQPRMPQYNGQEVMQQMSVPLPPVQNRRVMNITNEGRDAHGCFNEYNDY